MSTRRIAGGLIVLVGLVFVIYALIALISGDDDPPGVRDAHGVDDDSSERHHVDLDDDPRLGAYDDPGGSGRDDLISDAN
jgi:hypothetical protein